VCWSYKELTDTQFRIIPKLVLPATCLIWILPSSCRLGFLHLIIHVRYVKRQTMLIRCCFAIIVMVDTISYASSWSSFKFSSSFGIIHHCRNRRFGLGTKAKGLQRCGPKGSPGVTSGTPGSVGKREGVNPHTPKAIPALGDGVPVDSRNFRDRFEGSNLNGLWRSLYQWKALEA
jgi:hypothetical protein